MASHNVESPSVRLFLSPYIDELIKGEKKGDIEIPRFSRRILGLAIEEAIAQYVLVHDKDRTVDPISVLDTTLELSLEVFRQKNPPIIVVRTYRDGFRTSKKSPYSIAVVQPSAPSMDQYDEEETESGKLLTIKEEASEQVEKELVYVIEQLKKVKVDFVCFPELSFLDKGKIYRVLSEFGREKDCFVVAGSFHDRKKLENVSVIFSPLGAQFRQRKIFRAGCEGIKEKPIEFLNMIDFLHGGFCVLICIDSEREAIREVLKEALETGKCPILVFSPSHTEHPDRSVKVLANNLMLLISAAIVFCNSSHKGGSTILVPLTKLKKEGFRLFKLDSSDGTKIRLADVDLALLMKNRTSKQKGIVSMIR